MERPDFSSASSADVSTTALLMFEASLEVFSRAYKGRVKSFFIGREALVTVVRDVGGVAAIVAGAGNTGTGFNIFDDVMDDDALVAAGSA